MKVIRASVCVRDYNFRELNHREGSDTYKFVTLKPLIVGLDDRILPKGYKMLFRDETGKEVLSIYENTLEIHPGYVWNGCSPKHWFKWTGWIGTPDFEKTILASCVHDALRTFESTVMFPMSRNTVDDIFGEILRYERFWLRPIYYWVVKLASPFQKITENPKLTCELV